MLGIKNITRGRFGNRILQYNNAIQISKKHDIETYCEKWEGHDWFEYLVDINTNFDNLPKKEIKWYDIYSDEYLSYLDDHDCYIEGSLIHNFFYKLTNEPPKKFLKLKEKFIPNFNSGELNVGIHIRGGDIIKDDGNNGREIHTFEYYKDSIDYLNDNIDIGYVHICTDDVEYDLVKKVIDYCRNVLDTSKVLLGPSTDNNSLPHIYDFGILTECDYLISSSSTYVITAGFLGREKKIIHSKEWLEKNISNENYIKWGNYSKEYDENYWKSYDSFWEKIYNGGNEFYKAWKII